MKRALTVACAALVLVFAAGALAKKKPKKKADDQPPLGALQTVLDAQAEPVANCALPAVDAGPVTVNVRLMINNQGKLLQAQVTVDPKTPATDQARECVEKALGAVAWPPIKDPLVTIEKFWKFTPTK